MVVFKAGGALNPEEHCNIIVHRAELDLFIKHIENGELYIALRSPRQTGKTTLLYQIQACLHGQGYGVVFLDLSGLNDLDKADFYQTICTDIRDGLADLIDKTTINSLNPQDVTNQRDFCNYLKWLSGNTPQARKLIFALDEIEGVPEDVSLTLFPRLRWFFHRGRHSSQERDLYRKVMFVFTGALGLRRLMQGENSPLSNICKIFTLEDFSQKQVIELAKNSKVFAPDIVEIIANSVYEWCSGHPYLTHRLYELIEESNAFQGTYINQLPAIVNQLVEKYFIYGNNANLAHIFNYLLENDKSCQDSVFKVLNKEQLKSVNYDQDILTVGIIRRSNDLYLTISNKIYEKALKNFFEQED